ncbi:MAG: hypothetical protein II075_02710 [Bacteroidales bacterium]|jgi:hypothetical protein|nr:hypothetical protein [Bacteroidales bacterium]
MKKTILFLAALLIAIAAGAQTLQDVVYLLNGSVIRGTLIEQVPNVKIRTADGSLWVFKQDEIDKITSEPVEQQSAQNQFDESQYVVPQTVTTNSRANSLRHGWNLPLTKGFRLFVDFSYMNQMNYYTCSALSYSVSFGWQFLPQFYAGAGLASQIYIDYWYYGFRQDTPELYAQLPMFFDFRYDVMPGKIAPFADFRIGYALSADESNDYSGFYLNPSAGIRLGKISLSVGTDLVKLHDPWYYEEKTTLRDFRYSTVKWQATVMFKFAYEWGGRF